MNTPYIYDDMAIEDFLKLAKSRAKLVGNKIQGYKQHR